MRARVWISLGVVALLAPSAALAQKKRATTAKPAPVKEQKLPPFPPQAKSAIAIEESTGKVLYEKNADAKRYPASTTKILTALLLLEHTKPTDVIVAPKDVEKVTGASLHLKPGEKLTARQMLYALMLRSANDGCYAVAKHISGSLPAFAKLMNQRAAEIGCTSTNFNNPHGLNDDKHWTSARDLALMAREAMKRPEFREVVRTRKHQITRSMNQEDRWLISKNRPLGKDPTADGIKTGYTNPAGHCYVGSATRNGFRVITVVLASPDWQAEHFALMDYSFKHFEKVCLEQPRQTVRPVPIAGGAKATVGAVVTQPVHYIQRKNVPSPVRVELKAEGLTAPIEQGAPVGTAVFTDGAGWVFEAPLVAAESVEAGSPLRAAMGPFGPVAMLFVCAMGGGAYWFRRKTRNWA